MIYLSCNLSSCHQSARPSPKTIEDCHLCASDFLAPQDIRNVLSTPRAPGRRADVAALIIVEMNSKGDEWYVLLTLSFKISW